MKYSIAIPAYKAKFLKEAIDSILLQTYSDLEVVVLNDASPENVKDIVSGFHDSRIRYYENERNVGAIDVVDNWNKLLELARGDFFICMGDDDMLAPTCLEEYNRCIERYPNLDVYHARTMMIDENSVFCDLQEERPEWQSVYSLIWHYTFKNGIQFVGDFLYKTEALRSNGGFYKLPLAWTSDCITSFIAASRHGIANTSIPSFYYRRNRSSITSTSYVKQKMEATRLYGEWMNEFLREKPTNIEDQRYWRLIKEGIEGRIKHHEIYMIGDSTKDHIFSNVIYWWKNYKRYGLRFTQYCFSIGIGIALKFR